MGYNFKNITTIFDKKYLLLIENLKGIYCNKLLDIEEYYKKEEKYEKKIFIFTTCFIL